MSSYGIGLSRLLAAELAAGQIQARLHTSPAVVERLLRILDQATRAAGGAA